jgi:hypothetical protein
VQRSDGTKGGAVGQANARKLTVCSKVEHVFAHQKRLIALVVRSIGITRPRVKIGMVNLASVQISLWLPDPLYHGGPWPAPRPGPAALGIARATRSSTSESMGGRQRSVQIARFLWLGRALLRHARNGAP